MAAASATSSSELPECPVCHDGYKEPKILPCTHLACKKCVVSWLQKAGVKGGCPLCRAPILPSTSRGQRDLDTLVNDLPTDLATMALVDSHKVLSGQHVCMLCDNNSAATSFCLQCDVKICKACIKVHKNIPSTRKHVIEDLDKLSPQQLAQINRATCNVHDDRPAELYCSTHQELICMLCATANHRSCAEVKAIPDVVTEKRRELEQQAQRLRDRATALATEIQEVTDTFKAMRKKANDMFDDLEQCLKKRRQEVNTLIQAEEDAVMTSLAELEKWRAALALNAASVGNVVQSASGGSLLGMMKGLTSRLDDLESQTGTARKMEVKDLTLNVQKLDQLRADIASLGQLTKPATTPTTLQQPTQPSPATPTATSATTPRTAYKYKPRHVALAKVLKVGDRVKPGPDWLSVMGSKDKKGTVTAFPSRLAAQWGWDPQGLVDVQWDGGLEHCCWMGYNGQYQLDLL
ncbi:transcription intermediary factor 1-beta-like [Littorina saxatilis]|uniref:transcription intermediary factor 1-beta-like n=1 Tax=Littorina saxatilis TaxID=31220 RepID=UPI0038B42B95